MDLFPNHLSLGATADRASFSQAKAYTGRGASIGLSRSPRPVFCTSCFGTSKSLGSPVLCHQWAHPSSEFLSLQKSIQIMCTSIPCTDTSRAMQPARLATGVLCCSDMKPLSHRGIQLGTLCLCLPCGAALGYQFTCPQTPRDPSP